MAPLITITIQALLGSVGLKQHQAPIPISIPSQISVPVSAPSVKSSHEQSVKAYGPKTGTISLSAVSWGVNRNDVFGQDLETLNISHKFWDGQGWQPTGDNLENLGGTGYPGVSPVAVSWGPNRLDVFSRDDDGHLTHKYWDGTAWQPSETGTEVLGGGLDTQYSSLAATSWGEGRLDVFGISASDGSLLHKYWDGSQWNPQGNELENLGGSIYSGISAVSWGPGRLDVVGADRNQRPIHIYYDGTKWSDWENINDAIGIKEPVIISWGPNRLDIFGTITQIGGPLVHVAWDGTRWLDWESLGGAGLKSPVGAVSWGPNRLDVVALGADANYYYKYWDGSQWNPNDNTLIKKAGAFNSAPALVSWGTNRLDIFGVTDEFSLAHQTWYGSGWYPEWTFEDLGGPVDVESINSPEINVIVEKGKHTGIID